MLYDEYKETFEKIVELTEKLEIICKKGNIEDADEFDAIFTERDKLFQKLSTPEDIDQEKLNYIISLSEKFQEKNKFILRYIQVARNEIKKAIIETKEEEKVIEAYKIPKGDIANSSIFDSLE